MYLDTVCSFMWIFFSKIFFLQRMDFRHNTGHLKSLQSFAFTFPALDPCKHLRDFPLKSVVYIWKEDIPLCSKVKYYFSIILMTNLTQSEITDLASRAQLKTKTTH